MKAILIKHVKGKTVALNSRLTIFSIACSTPTEVKNSGNASIIQLNGYLPLVTIGKFHKY